MGSDGGDALAVGAVEARDFDVDLVGVGLVGNGASGKTLALRTNDGAVSEGAGARSQVVGSGGGVGLGEGDSAGRLSVDLLATGDFDVL